MGTEKTGHRERIRLIGKSPTLRVSGLTKRFGEVVANDSVSLDVCSGEVHCLLGENGAGKSTLIAMLAGLLQPDAGVIEFDGTPRTFASPAAAIARGIGVVYQHSALIPSMTVLENLMLGQQAGFWLDRAAATLRLSELSKTLGMHLGQNDRVSDLSLGQRQRLDIAKVLWHSPRVLVLDEPTSMLTQQGVDELFVGVRELAKRGVAVLLVTHKLDEALALGDRITVLREGRVVRRFRVNELGIEKDRARGEIVAAMFGDASSTPLRLDRLDRRLDGRSSSLSRCSPSTGLTLDRISTPASSALVPLDEVTLHLAAGEILGVAGIDGQGQRQLAEVIAGQCMPSVGRVLLDGEEITKLAVRERQLRGVRYVTDDRLSEGIVGSLSVSLNLLLKRIGERPFWRGWRMDRPVVREHADRLITQYGIRTASSETAAGTLSGGNIQKILLARELDGEPRVVVFHKPSYGLDVRTVQLVHEKIRTLAAAGVAVLLISTELDQLTELSHRIAVISEGRIVSTVENDGAAVRERVGALIAGGA